LAPASRSEGARDGRLSVSGRRAAQGLGVLFAVACLLQTLSACGKRRETGDPEVNAGRALYMSHCISCHNVDPSRDGSLGPAIKGSSLELVRARVLRGEYPAGYVPKRTTHIMVKLPLMEEDVARIHKFLNAP
jgi:mono/diheme cytochrome c family protein